MDINFQGKTVLITGASRGIGERLAIDFHRAGASLVLTASTPRGASDLKKRFSARKGPKVQCLPLDLNDRDSVKCFIDAVGKQRVDVCINNAGTNEIDLLEDIKEQDWDKIMQVNLKGPFVLMRTLSRNMKARRYGRIVNIASIFGVVTRPKRSVYSSSKAGLLGLTRTAAIELAPFNVLVNAVSPGFVLTDLTRRMLSKKEIKALTRNVPMGRMASPADISATVLFLASDLNTYIVGQNIIVDGGYVNV